MGDRSAKRALGGFFLINMNPLMIFGTVGKLINLTLRYFCPVRKKYFFADKFLHLL